jgi:hypothetical protein
MDKPIPATPVPEAAPRRPYSVPALTVYGPATVLTQGQPQSRPTETGGSATGAVRILFLGDNV